MATVVLLHPFPQDSSFWDEAAEVVRAAGHEVIAPNLPGFGGRALEPGWTMAGEAERLAGDIPAGSAVVGLSMGGYLALALLAAHPDRVGSLVLADTRASAEAPEGMAVRRDTAEALRRDGSAAFLDGFVPRALGPDPDPKVVARLRAIADRQPAEAMADATMAIAMRDDHTALLPGITVPTLLVVGEHDAVACIVQNRRLIHPHDAYVRRIRCGDGDGGACGDACDGAGRVGTEPGHLPLSYGAQHGGCAHPGACHGALLGICL